jgi:hypothetical protein
MGDAPYRRGHENLAGVDVLPNIPPWIFGRNKIVILIVPLEVATPSPGRFSPRPRVRLLIVVWLRWATGRCGLIRPPSLK